MNIPIVVTDHAVLRYLERVHGLDVEFFRRHIAGLATNGAALGATGVRIEGVNLILRGATVVTVLESRMHALPPPGGIADMASRLPLFEVTELAAIKARREELLRRLQRVRMDAHSRIRTEQKVALLTAEQMRLELQLQRGS